MHIFGFRSEDEVKIVIDTFMQTPEWTVEQCDREKFPGFPAAAISSLNQKTHVITLTFINPNEVSRVAAVIERRV